MKRNSSKWKKTEADAAEVVCTKRTPFSGSNSGLTASDSLHDRLFLECKTKETHSTATLYKSTRELAQKEHKIPVLILRENGQQEILWVIEQKDLFKLIREVDLSKVDQRFPPKTTIHKLVETSSSENRSLYDMKEQLTIELKRIVREKVVSGDNLQSIKSIGALLDMIDTISDYSREA